MELLFNTHNFFIPFPNLTRSETRKLNVSASKVNQIALRKLKEMTYLWIKASDSSLVDFQNHSIEVCHWKLVALSLQSEQRRIPNDKLWSNTVNCQFSAQFNIRAKIKSWNGSV